MESSSSPRKLALARKLSDMGDAHEKTVKKAKLDASGRAELKRAESKDDMHLLVDRDIGGLGAAPHKSKDDLHIQYMQRKHDAEASSMSPPPPPGPEPRQQRVFVTARRRSGHHRPAPQLSLTSRGDDAATQQASMDNDEDDDEDEDEEEEQKMGRTISDSFADLLHKFANLLPPTKHQQQEQCPLCAAPVQLTQFAAHVYTCLQIQDDEALAKQLQTQLNEQRQLSAIMPFLTDVDASAPPAAQQDVFPVCPMGDACTADDEKHFSFRVHPATHPRAVATPDKYPLCVVCCCHVPQPLLNAHVNACLEEQQPGEQQQQQEEEEQEEEVDMAFRDVRSTLIDVADGGGAESKAAPSPLARDDSSPLKMTRHQISACASLAVQLHGQANEDGLNALLNSFGLLGFTEENLRRRLEEEGDGDDDDGGEEEKK